MERKLFEDRYPEYYGTLGDDEKNVLYKLQAKGFLFVKDEDLDDNPARARSNLDFLCNMKRMPGRAYILKIVKGLPDVCHQGFLAIQDIVHTLNEYASKATNISNVSDEEMDMYKKGMKALEDTLAAMKKATNDLSMGALGHPVEKKQRGGNRNRTMRQGQRQTGKPVTVASDQQADEMLARLKKAQK